jgi:hypothetical protein
MARPANVSDVPGIDRGVEQSGVDSCEIAPMSCARIAAPVIDAWGGVSEVASPDGRSQSYRANFQYRDARKKINIHGPRRAHKRRAEEDVESMRASARGKTAKPDVYEAVAVEGRRLQERAEFEGTVAAARPLEAPASFDQAPSSQSFDDDESESYEPQDYYNDVDEFWQDIDEDGRLPNWTPAPVMRLPTPTSVVEATAMLSKFRSARNALEDLQKILDARADPNIVVGSDIHPLMKVMTFANRDRVGPMRDALLRAGAVENDELKERWAIRQRADASEDAWTRNFHRDPR